MTFARGFWLAALILAAGWGGPAKLAFGGDSESESMTRMVQAGLDRTKIAAAEEPKSVSSQEIMLRQINRLYFGAGMVETNLYAVISDQSAFTSSEQTVSPTEFRSSSGQNIWHSSDHLRGIWAFDRFYGRWQSDWALVTVGRQAINWSTTSFFVPNDFFAPFGAETFFRTYKAGVDAALVEVGLSDLSLLSFVHVAGYRPDRENSASNTYTPDLGSTLVRYTNNIADWDLSLAVGEIQDLRTVAVGFQGEIPPGVSLRVAGNAQQHRDQQAQRRLRRNIAINLERLVTEDLLVQAETYLQTAGADTVGDYAKSQALGLRYAAQSYSAIGLGQQWSPLVRGQYLVIANHSDGSAQLLTFHGVSLSDEADLSCSLAGSIGRVRDHQDRVTEFGQNPYSYTLAFTAYW